MSVFRSEINVVDASLATPTEEAIEQGESPRVEIELMVGQVLPFANPKGDGPMVISIGSFSFSFGKEQAINFFKGGLEAAESLPDEKKTALQIATSLDGVDKVAGNLNRLKGDASS